MANLLKTFLVAFVFAGLALLAPSAAQASNVIFGTTGSLTCNGCSGSGTNAVTFGTETNTLTLTFTGIGAGSMVDASPTTFASFGEIKTTVTGSGATITPGTSLTLTINQTAPGVGSGDLAGALTGTIQQDSSSGVITFNVTSVTINGVRYDIVNNPLALVPPVTNGGVTTIQGQVTTTVPEPSSLLLMGTGLLGAIGAVRRKLKIRSLQQ